jgi:hypothetical protein
MLQVGQMEVPLPLIVTMENGKMNREPHVLKMNVQFYLILEMLLILQQFNLSIVLLELV